MEMGFIDVEQHFLERPPIFFDKKQGDLENHAEINLLLSSLYEDGISNPKLVAQNRQIIQEHLFSC